MLQRLDVKSYVENEYNKLGEITKNFTEKELNDKELVIFQVGDDPASNKYVGNKLKKMDMLGLKYQHKVFAKDTEGYIEFLDLLHKYRGIGTTTPSKLLMLQLPVPKKFEFWVDSLGDTDVDGISSSNKMSFAVNMPSYIPCTARGIRDYMKYIDKNLKGKSVLIINRSQLVGKPLSQLLLDEDMLVTVAHSHISKKQLEKSFKNYDYIISGVGIPEYFDSDDLCDRNTFIDVGINFNSQGKMCGDLKISNINNSNAKYTPVPGGVGQLTVLSLMKNIIEGPQKRF